MDFAEISIKDKPLFDKYIKTNEPQISEQTFTNFFAWRDFYKFRYTLIDGLLCVVAVPIKGEPFAMQPLGELNDDNFGAAVSRLRSYFKEKGWEPVFRRVTGDGADRFKALCDSEHDIAYDRDNSDYLYLTSDLMNLKGKKFDGKRNHINRFKKNHTFEYVQLDSKLVEECERIMLEWCIERGCKCQHGENCERHANIDILENMGTLGVKGALIKADDSFEAFTVGELLNRDTAVIHIEKANHSIDGLYTLINQQFASHEWSETTYINREQDLGIEGLRKAKLSYNPVKLVDKYTVFVR